MTTPDNSVELLIGGMTCASCANRVEKKLNRMEGVTATVNYATEKAKVTFADGISTDDLVATVEATGYTASLPTLPVADSPEPADELKPLRERLIASIALALPVIALGMIPALQFDFWQWASLTLAAPVVTWAAWPFHKAAWTNLRHGAATMDTLISVGVHQLLRLVALRAVPRRGGHAGDEDAVHADPVSRRRRRGDLPRGRGRRDDVHPGRPVLRGPRQAPLGRCAEGPAGARRQGRRRPAGWRRGSASRPISSPSATSSWCGRARRSPPTA